MQEAHGQYNTGELECMACDAMRKMFYSGLTVKKDNLS